LILDDPDDDAEQGGDEGDDDGLRLCQGQIRIGNPKLLSTCFHLAEICLKKGVG
jgi:hypothetical protein